MQLPGIYIAVPGRNGMTGVLPVILVLVVIPVESTSGATARGSRRSSRGKFARISPIGGFLCPTHIKSNAPNSRSGI